MCMFSHLTTSDRICTFKYIVFLHLHLLWIHLHMHPICVYINLNLSPSMLMPPALTHDYVSRQQSPLVSLQIPASAMRTPSLDSHCLFTQLFCSNINLELHNFWLIASQERTWMQNAGAVPFPLSTISLHFQSHWGQHLPIKPFSRAAL